MMQFYSNFYESSMMLHGSLHKIMGTRFDIVIVGCEKHNAEMCWLNIIAELERLDKLMNRYDAESEISKINREAHLKEIIVPDELWQILMDCKEYYQRTSGLFDITLKDFSLVELNENKHSVFFSSHVLSFDFGAFAKGYALEKIKAILKNSGITNALINFGNSSVLALGHHPYSGHWSINIENPYKTGQLLDKINLTDKAMSTSGNMPSHSSHIVNTATGAFNTEKKIVCVVTGNAAEAEVLTTALMIANAEQRAVIEQRFNMDELKIYNDLY